MSEPETWDSEEEDPHFPSLKEPPPVLLPSHGWDTRILWDSPVNVGDSSPEVWGLERLTLLKGSRMERPTPGVIRDSGGLHNRELAVVKACGLNLSSGQLETNL